MEKRFDIFLYSPAAVSFDQMMRHNDLRSRKVRIFDMADHLGRRFHSKLSGINVNGGQLRGSQSGEQGVIKGKDGQILWYGNARFQTDLLQ